MSLPPKEAAKTPQRSTLRKGEARWAYLLILPTVLGLLTFSIWPAVQTFYFSFTEWGAFGRFEWLGPDNYLEAFQDPELGRAFINTLLYTAITMVGVPIAIVLAAMVNRRGMRGVAIYRVLYFLPVVTLPSAVALIWRLLYNGDYGVVNWFLGLVGIEARYWISDPSVVIVAVGVVSIWSSIGYNMVLFLAGLQSIPNEVYEAAEIDGAGPVRQFLSVTVPLLTPTTFFVVVITMINTLQAFDLIFLMLGRNNPAIGSARTVVYMFYERGIEENNGGYAAAIGFLLLAVILVFTAIQFRLQKRWVHYD